jgi:hypothetical protein
MPADKAPARAVLEQLLMLAQVALRMRPVEPPDVQGRGPVKVALLRLAAARCNLGAARLGPEARCRAPARQALVARGQVLVGLPVSAPGRLEAQEDQLAVRVLPGCGQVAAPARGGLFLVAPTPHTERRHRVAPRTAEHQVQARPLAGEAAPAAVVLGEVQVVAAAVAARAGGGAVGRTARSSRPKRRRLT